MARTREQTRRRSAKRRRRKRKPRWTQAHVRRLFWRAGFGARPDEIETWTRRGRAAAIEWLVDGDGKAELDGEAARPDGRPLNPRASFEDAQLWWLDRMVRTRRPLVERMTLLWHGHFATKANPLSMLVDQNETLRAHALGRFEHLAKAVTRDPAMLQFLNLANSWRDEPNENFARELMELFAMGEGYTEDDIRQASLALTGWRQHRRKPNDPETTWYDGSWHHPGPQTIFGRSASYDWEAVVDLVCAQKAHGHFLVRTLWSAFVTEPLDRRTERRLVRLYRRSGLAIAPVVREILGDDALYAKLGRPAMVKSPAVFLAGMLRTTGNGVTTREFGWMLPVMGQLLLDPPSVAGWDEGPAWMSTSSVRTRFVAAGALVDRSALKVPRGSTPSDLTATAQVSRAWEATGRPQISSATRRTLVVFAERVLASGSGDAQHRADGAQHALRLLLLAGPEAHLC